MKKSLRQFKKQQAREAFFNAALDLFFKKGFDETTVEEIAGRAAVSRRTFFRYFEGKDDVLVAWMDEMGLRIQADLRANLETAAPFAALKVAIMTNAQTLLADLDYAIALTRLIYRTPSIESLNARKYMKWEKEFAAILLKGKISSKAHLEARLLSARAVDALRISLEIWSEGDFKGDVQALMERAFQAAKGPIQ